MMSFLSSWHRWNVAWVTALLVLSWMPASKACGYHDDVSIARGALNWIYPDALHVIGAISSAVAQKQLTYRQSDPARPDLFGSQYQAIAKALERFAELLGGGPDDASSLSFALVLVEPMLWTHFEVGLGAPRTWVHIPGPQPDQLVLVSGQAVIHAIANDGLGIAEAYRLGLIRAYGQEEKVARFQSLSASGRQAATLHAAQPQ